MKVLNIYKNQDVKNKTQKTIFISDLHLEENRPNMTQLFFQLLQKCDSTVDALFILGDLFEVWIGDDDDTPFYHEIIKAFKSATQKGLKIYFLHGNRDFLIGKRFLRATGCQLLTEEQKILLYDTPILVMHGDTLCTDDITYLKIRKKFHNRFLKGLFLSLPRWMRKKIAHTLRAKSSKYTQSTPSYLMDVTQSAVEKVMQKHQVTYLIHGHTHRPHFHKFDINDQQAQRIVLGAWHKQGNMLIWESSDRRTWVEF